MPKFNVTAQWSGYSRGYTVYEVEAASEDEARENFRRGKRVEHETVRDDTEIDRDDINVETIPE